MLKESVVSEIPGVTHNCEDVVNRQQFDFVSSQLKYLWLMEKGTISSCPRAVQRHSVVSVLIARAGSGYDFWKGWRGTVDAQWTTTVPIPGEPPKWGHRQIITALKRNHKFNVFSQKILSRFARSQPFTGTILHHFFINSAQNINTDSL